MSDTPDTPETTPTQAEPAPPREAPARRVWLAPVVATVAAAVLLLVLLIPGVLRYPNQPDAAVVTALEDGNRTLRAEIERLGGLERAGVCTYDGELYPLEVEKAETPPDPSQRVKALTPPPRKTRPEPEALPEEEAAEFQGSMDDLLRRSTVLVLNMSGPGLGSGTGFFISPTQIATNAHVVGNAMEVIVTNDLIGAPLTARIVATTGIPDPNKLPQRDFALLELDGAPETAMPLSFADAKRTQAVFASGYPGFFVEREVVAYAQSIARNQPGTPPQGVVTNGIVTTTQNADRPEGPLGFIPHTAVLSPGNSGGPLVDICGRVVGINSFIRQSDTDEGGELVLHGDYALASGNLASFLEQNGVMAKFLSSACDGATRLAAD